jgi:PKD repeat protein
MATTLTATVSDGTDINYIWDFGDGVTGIGPVVSHVYPAGGIYTAVVTATNMVSGQSAVTAVVIVAAEYKVYMPAVVGKPD